MAGVLSMLTGSLPPTATYCRRSWVWIPGGPDGRLGTLTIQLQKGERRGRRTVSVESDSYAIDWDTEPLTGVMGRAMLLANETDPDAAEVYKVVCGPRWSCNCKAALCKLECKHAAAIRAMIEAGGISGEE